MIEKDMIYLTTHLVMAVCIMTIVHMMFTFPEYSSDPENIPRKHRIYNRGLKLIALAASTIYRVAVSILVSYMK
jgi:hypothetical protein